MRYSVPIMVLCLIMLLGGCLGSKTSGRPGRTAQDREAMERETAAADALDKAMQLYHDGEFLEPESALMYLNEAIELDPTLVNARYQRTVLLIDQGRINEAMADVNAVIKARPDHKEARYARGFILMNAGDYAGAVRDFSAVIDRDNTIADVYAKRGLCYANLNRPDDAVHDFSQALAINPANVEANYNRGLAYMKLGEYKQAAHDLTQAFSLNPSSYDIIMARAAAYMKLGKYERVVGDLRRAIEQQPTRSGLYALLGEGLAGTGDIKGAIKAVEKALLLVRSEGDTGMAAVYQGQLDEYLAAPAPKSGQ